MRLPSRSTRVGATPLFRANGVTPQQSAMPSQIAQIGGALQQAGSTAFGIVDEKQRQLNLSRIKEADNRAADLFREHMGAYLATRGKDATGQNREQTFSRLEESLRSVADGLDNEEQSARYWELVEDRMVGARTRADSHETEQVRIDAIGQTEARIESALVDAVAAVGTDEYEYHRQIMLGEVDERLRLDGIGEDDPRRRVARLGATTQLHSIIVQNLVQRGNASAARDYLEGAKGEVDAENLPRLQGLVQRATVDEDSTRLQFDILDKIRADFAYSSLGPGKAPTVDDTNEAWRKAYDAVDERWRAGEITAEVRDATRARLRDEEGARRRDQANVVDSTMRAAEKWLIDNPAASVAAMPADIYQEADRLGIVGDLNAFAESGRRFTTDPEEWARVNDMGPQALRAMPVDELVRLRGKLDPQQWNVLLARRATAFKSATAEQQHLVSIEDRMRRAARQIGVLPATGKANDRQAAAYAEWQFAMDQRLQMLQQRLGRKATDDELQQFFDREVVQQAEQITVDEQLGLFHLYSTLPVTRTMAQVAESEFGSIRAIVGREEVYLRDVPTDVRLEIEAALIARGQPLTVTNILTEWVAEGRPRSAR